MNAFSDGSQGGKRDRRGVRAAIGCEALEGRQLLSRGFGMGGLGGMGFGRGPGAIRAELGSFGGGRPGGMFGGGSLGLGGGARDPLFLLTAPILQATSGTTAPPSRAVLGSSAVQSAFQTLQTDSNNVVPAGARPTHASVGQLQDDLLAIRKGTLTGTAATAAVQNDEAAILTSLGLTSSQVGQIQADIQGVQSAIQAASSGTSITTTTTTGGSTAATAPTTSTTQAPNPWMPMGNSTATPPAADTAVQSASQALQTDIRGALSANAQPTFASIGQVLDDLGAINKGTLTGSQALAAVKTDTATVFSGAGATAGQVAQIQSDQVALATAIQSAQTPSSGSSTASSSTSSNTTAAPGSIAAVQATLQSVQPYLVGVPGVGGGMGGGLVGPMMPMSGATGGPMTRVAQAMGGGMGGPMFFSTSRGGAAAVSGWNGNAASTAPRGPATGQVASARMMPVDPSGGQASPGTVGGGPMTVASTSTTTSP